MKKDDGRRGISRRQLFRRAGAVAATSAVLGPAATVFANPDVADVRTQGPGPVDLELTVNGETRKVKVEPRETLLDVLRLPLDATGAKRVCDRGPCGACTVLVDGKAVVACMMLAVDAEGRKVKTVEGLAAGEGKALLDAFVAKDALQCGFCTPGMVVSCMAALREHGPGLTLEHARAATVGNLCRCGTYPHVLEAAVAAAKSAERK
jgi:aerobic-type carbon monoxide dehydrogenase small subunit (CoxS/CutS family)